MEERVTLLEGHYQALDERMKGLEQKTDKIINILSEHRAKELPPLQTILTTAAIVAGLLGSFVTGFFWLVDARVGAAVSDANRFVSQMTDRGGIWVKLADIDHRISDQQKSLDSLFRMYPPKPFNDKVSDH